jgi:hypothetical protein
MITGFSINGPNDESVLWYCEYSSVENVADVALITAAPNLLAVCRDTLRKLERDGSYKNLQARLRDVIAYAGRDVDCGNGFVIATRDGVCSYATPLSITPVAISTDGPGTRLIILGASWTAWLPAVRSEGLLCTCSTGAPDDLNSRS